MTKIKELTNFLENWAPLNYQEDYDNAGLIVGDENSEINKVLITLDCTETVVKEAITRKANFIIAHHPIVFKGLKRLNGSNYVEKTILLAIKNDIAIYAIHTNLDHVMTGVNWKIAEKLNLKNIKILLPKANLLEKLTAFVPCISTEKVLESLHNAGAGQIGNYKNCSFTVNGVGRFVPFGEANPTIGQINILEKVNEDRLEVIYPAHLQSKVIIELKKAHPYEEVAYYVTKLENTNQTVGAGAIGELEYEMNELEFLKHLKASMNLEVIKYTPVSNKLIKRVALCGGSGSFLLKEAKKQNADAFVTSDFKYHEFFDAENEILIADIGHFESEVFTKELIHFYISKKFVNFASLLSDTPTNPVKYFY